MPSPILAAFVSWPKANPKADYAALVLINVGRFLEGELLVPALLRVRAIASRVEPRPIDHAVIDDLLRHRLEKRVDNHLR